MFDDEEENPLVFESYDKLDSYNNNLVETNVRFLGNKTIVAEIVQLLAYIRHGIKNNANADIVVKLRNTVANPSLMMDVNSLEVPDLVIQPEIQIN